MSNCNNNDSIQAIRDDIKELRQDVKSLLKFKWQLMGGAVTMSVVVSFVIKLVKL